MSKLCSALIVLFYTNLINGLDEKPISRLEFLSPQDHASVKLSYDGKWVAYVGNCNGIPNIFVQSLPNGIPKLLTKDLGRGVSTFQLAYDNKSILYQQDSGDENFQLYIINVETEETREIFNEPGVTATVLATTYKRPYEIVIGINKRSPTYTDAYLVDLRNCKRKLLYENNCFNSLMFDNNLRLRIGYNETSCANGLYYYFKDNGRQELMRNVPPFDTIATKPIYIDPEGIIYWMNNEDVDKAGLMSLDPKTKERRYLYTARKSDLWNPFFHPTVGRPLWIYEYYVKPEMVLLDLTYEKDFKIFFNLTSSRSYTDVQMSLDANKWLLTIVYDNKPSLYYIYDKLNPKNKLQCLFAGRDRWLNHNFSKTYAYDITTSDGMVEMCYINIPLQYDNRGKPTKPLPTLVLVHGGPTSRDNWDFVDPYFPIQFYTDRYVILRCNYRGSTGYGKVHANAGNGEWGRNMQLDLTEAVQWCIAKNFTNPKKVAIVGGSYGGYAALAGIAFTPDLYTCAVAYAAPSNLVTLSKMTPILPSLNLRVGNDAVTGGGEKFLRSRSPLFFKDCIKTPLLIMHGDLDTVVDETESEQIVNALKNTSVPVTFVRFPDEGHITVRSTNVMAQMALTDEFLGNCLDGKYEPITIEVEKSSACVVKHNILNSISLSKTKTFE